GLNGVSVDAHGNLNNTAAYGISVNGGVSGLHSWKHTTLGLDYRAGVRHYPKQTFFDGTEQNLMLGVTQLMSRHTTLAIRQSAGIYSGAYNSLVLPQTVRFDPAKTYAPPNALYHNRMM